MNREEIVELLKEVAGPNFPVVHHTKWVSFCCLLAPWTHAGGADSSPSSGISVKDGDTSVFHCWGCGSKGTVPWLLRELEKYTGENYKAIISNIEDGEFLGGTLPEWGDRRRSVVEDRFLDASYLDLYDSAAGHWYLRDRGIDDAVALAMNLLVDPEDSDGDERILFPVFDRTNRLQGFSGRAVLDSAKLRVRDYHGFVKANALLGLHLVDPADKFVVVVEGLFDMAVVYQYGYAAVATMHAGLTDWQFAKLKDLGKPLLFMFDNDKAGIDATERAIEKVGPALPMSIAKYVARKDAKGKKVWAKDPGACTMEEVDQMIAKAVIV